MSTHLPPTADQWIRHLQLLPHPEGGFYRETYRSTATLPSSALPPTFTGTGGERSASTAIYFLLPAGHFSAFHRIRSDEVWHFHAGGSLEIVQLSPAGELRIDRLGADLAAGDAPQHVVPAGWWFAARPAPGTVFTLVGCTVAPGFDFADFTMADRAELSAAHPAHAKLIATLTYG